MRKSKEKILTLTIIMLLLLGVAFIYILSHNSKLNTDKLTPDSDAADYDGDHQTLQLSNGTPGIAIAGQSQTLVFVADQTSQQVNIYNPERNDCLMLPSLYVDDVQIWRGGYLAPGKAYYTIELSTPLESGTYPAYILYECVKEDGTPLNNAKVKFKIIVKE